MNGTGLDKDATCQRKIFYFSNGQASKRFQGIGVVSYPVEPITSYFTKEGWKKDFQKTMQDFTCRYNSSKLDDLVRDEKGNDIVEFLVATAAMPACAYGLSYLGEGIGYVWGNIIEFIPLVKSVAPWAAERAGLIDDAKTAVDLNENFYQTVGATSGFWGGLWFPWRFLSERIKSEDPYY